MSSEPNVYSNVHYSAITTAIQKDDINEEDGEIIGDDPFWLARIPTVSEKRTLLFAEYRK